MNRRSSLTNTQTIAYVGAFAALCYIGFQFLRIDIPVGTERTAFHFGNVFLMVASLLLGGIPGGLAGAIGMTIADLTSGYVTSAIPTFFLKFGIGLVAGGVAGKLKLAEETNNASIRKKALLALTAGALFNLIADPIVRYFYKLYIYGIPGDLAQKLAALGSLTTLVNGLLSIWVGAMLYLALRRTLERRTQK